MRNSPESLKFFKFEFFPFIIQFFITDFFITCVEIYENGSNFFPKIVSSNCDNCPDIEIFDLPPPIQKLHSKQIQNLFRKNMFLGVCGAADH